MHRTRESRPFKSMSAAIASDSPDSPEGSHTGSGVELTDIWRPIHYGRYATENGPYGSALLRDGGAGWVCQEFPSLAPQHGIWGTAKDDVYVVGDGGGISHFDGTEWRQCSNVLTGDAHGIWGSSTNDVFVVGVDGIFHSTGP